MLAMSSNDYHQEHFVPSKSQEARRYKRVPVHRHSVNSCDFIAILTHFFFQNFWVRAIKLSYIYIHTNICNIYCMEVRFICFLDPGDDVHQRHCACVQCVRALPTMQSVNSVQYRNIALSKTSLFLATLNIAEGLKLRCSSPKKWKVFLINSNEKYFPQIAIIKDSSAKTSERCYAKTCS